MTLSFTNNRAAQAVGGASTPLWRLALASPSCASSAGPLPVPGSRALGTRGGHQGAARGKKSCTPTAAHRQTSLLLPVLVRTSVALTLPETRASGRSANSPSLEPHEEYLELGSSEHTRAGAGVFHRAARGAAPGQGVLARGRRRQSHIGDSGKGSRPPEGE